MITLPFTQYYLNHKTLVDVLENNVITTVIPFVTFIVVTVATAITIVTLKRMMAWREETANTSRQKSQVPFFFRFLPVSHNLLVPNLATAVFACWTEAAVRQLQKTDCLNAKG